MSVLAGCGDDGAESPSAATAGAPVATTAAAAPTSTVAGDVAAPATTASAPQGGGAAAVPEALNFPASLVGGGEFDPAAYAGKPVAFWFWAPT